MGDEAGIEKSARHRNWMRKVGHIFIDRSNHEKALASLQKAKEKIVNGTSVMFFPEGTRSKDGSLGEFKGCF